MILVLIALTAFVTANREDPEPLVTEVIHNTIQYRQSNQIGIFGQFRSPEFVNKTAVFAKFTTTTPLPEGVTIVNVTLVFRRHHCNCWIQDGAIIANTEDFQSFPFASPIEDDAMTFQGHIFYSVAEGVEDIQLTEVEYQLVLTSAQDGSAEKHTLASKLSFGQEAFGTMFKISGPRQSRFNEATKTTETPIQPQILFSGLKYSSLQTVAATGFRFTPIGRFQFRETKDKLECNWNNVKLTANIVIVDQFNTYAELEFAGKFPAVDGDFAALSCSDDFTLYPTNAVTQFKYDLAFYSIQATTRGELTKLAQFGSYRNIPDVIPHTLTASKTLLDNTGLLCQFDINFEPKDYVIQPKIDINKDNTTGKDTVGIYYPHLQLKQLANRNPLRVDIVRTVFDEKYKLSIPIESSLANFNTTNSSFEGVGIDNIGFNLKRFANLTQGTSIITYLDLSTVEGADAIKYNELQCVLSFVHPNGNKDNELAGLYNTVAQPIYIEPFAKTLDATFKLVKEEATFEIHVKELTKMDPIKQFEVTLPMANWVFSGDLAAAPCTVINHQGTEDIKYTITPTFVHQKGDDSRFFGITFPLDEEQSQKINTGDVTFNCPNLKIVSKNPQFEFHHETTVLNMIAKTVKGQFSNSTILDLQPNDKIVKAVFAIFISIMGLAALVMFICFSRCVFLSCTKKEPEASDPLLVNSHGYNLE
jgi:hypothetical protein